MFWEQEDDAASRFRVATDVYDLVFRIRGISIDIDHAYALAQALQNKLGKQVCHRIGVHGIRLAESGNGWIRAEHVDSAVPLSRRARLAIRLGQQDHDRVSGISHSVLRLGHQEITVGDSSIRELSPLTTLFARRVACNREQAEVDFLGQTAGQLKAMGIKASKMVCGKSTVIRTGKTTLFTRSLLVAGMKPAESEMLQRQGIGMHQLTGCGLFVPHRGIEAVYDVQK